MASSGKRNAGIALVIISLALIPLSFLQIFQNMEYLRKNILFDTQIDNAYASKTFVLESGRNYSLIYIFPRDTTVHVEIYFSGTGVPENQSFDVVASANTRSATSFTASGAGNVQIAMNVVLGGNFTCVFVKKILAFEGALMKSQKVVLVLGLPALCNVGFLIFAACSRKRKPEKTAGQSVNKIENPKPLISRYSWLLVSRVVFVFIYCITILTYAGLFLDIAVQPIEDFYSIVEEGYVVFSNPADSIGIAAMFLFIPLIYYIGRKVTAYKQKPGFFPWRNDQVELKDEDVEAYARGTTRLYYGTSLLSWMFLVTAPLFGFRGGDDPLVTLFIFLISAIIVILLLSTPHDKVIPLAVSNLKFWKVHDRGNMVLSLANSTLSLIFVAWQFLDMAIPAIIFAIQNLVCWGWYMFALRKEKTIKVSNIYKMTYAFTYIVLQFLGLYLLPFFLYSLLLYRGWVPPSNLHSVLFMNGRVLFNGLSVNTFQIYLSGVFAFNFFIFMVKEHQKEKSE
nr:hypothetical protein [Candidatus Sigynarchaeum springense]